MKKSVYILSAVICFLLSYHVSSANYQVSKMPDLDRMEHVLKLSQKKWTWIINRQVDSLNVLFHDNIFSSQPGVRMDKRGHLDVIENGNIRYDHIDIIDTDIQFIGDTSILLTKVEFNYLGDKVKQVKSVKEIYQRSNKEWKLIVLQISPGSNE